VEQYFDAARTPLDQRTEIAISYLKGKAVQWWRGSGYIASTLPWYKFCGYITERFAERSICDNVKAFHALTQTSTVSQYIEDFEQLVNLVRRDNPNLPNDYYVNCFISGLTSYIQHHLQCHKPTTMQEATWLARRIEQSMPPRKPVYQPVSFQHRKPTYLDTQSSGPAQNPIQEAKLKQLCYKCKEPWFPGHKKVCKLANKVQIQALQAQADAAAEIIYVTEYDESDEEEVVAPEPEAVLKISMHAIQGSDKAHYTFTLTAKFGDVLATALVDSGSSATFMTPKLAQQAQCNLIPNKPVRVLVANGGNLFTEFHTETCNYSIQGQDLQYAFKILPLKGYDLVLGTDWIKHHSPVVLDYKKMFMQITVDDGSRLTFWDESLPTNSTIQSTDNINLLLHEEVCGAILFVNKVDYAKTT
jgi:hypothetical protein